MKRFLVMTTALVAMSATAALSADVPARAPLAPPAPIFTWTGFYVGLNAGLAFGSDHAFPRRLRAFLTDDVPVRDFVRQYNAGRPLGNPDNSGLTLGGQIGYNWQFGGFVAGVEADINYRDGNDRNGFTVLGTGRFLNYCVVHTGGDRGNWFGTLRPRLGYAYDRTLVYLTGGLAYGKSRNNGALFAYDTRLGVAPLPGYSWTANDNGSNWGWTLGAGVEHAFSDNWSLKLEYLYVDLDRGNKVYVNPQAPANAVFIGEADDKFHVFRLGLNYKFGGAALAGPVLARY